MSPKRWILLLIFYISYLMFGASIYYHIEHGEEKLQREDELKERIDIYEYLTEQLATKNVTAKNEILVRITDYCGKPVTDYTQDEDDIPYTWTFYHSFFFAFTVCSTVGYGNISPTTTLGRMIMIIYSVIGIPVNGILFAGLGEYFGRTFEAIYRRYKKYKMTTDMHYVPPQLGLITTVAIALIPGIALFLLLPSWVFSYFENWPYSIAFYYTYVTTSTIGFGDFVPTFGANQPREFGGWFVVYQIFVIVWFIFSLGYLLMIMTFITRGLQSKKLAYLEQQLSTNLKATQNRIWNGVTKDVGYLRRLLNELYILKVKPVYTEQDFSLALPRSNSCPELTMYRTEPAPVYGRKRAFSYDVNALQSHQSTHLLHASSDTEISKYDREKTFETAAAYRQTTDLLAKVVTALATVKPAPLDDEPPIYSAYHGLSDSQILASEWFPSNEFQSINDLTTAPRPRGRAASDFNIMPNWQTHRPTVMPHNEWTWSGDNDQIQEAINNRYKRHAADGKDQPFVVHLDEDEQAKKPANPPRTKKFSMPDNLRRLFHFRKSTSQDVHGNERKFSIASVPEATLAQRYDGSPVQGYSTVTKDAGSSYFYPEKPSAAIGSHPSLDGGITNLGFRDDNEQSSFNANTYQRNVAPSGTRKRRTSIYTQNTASNGRRSSMFPATGLSGGHMSRRGSLAATSSAAMATAAARRGSLFPATADAYGRRGSIFSMTSEKDLDVLEKTTLADLIRALEVVHTHAVLDEQQQSASASSTSVNVGHKTDKKQRKYGNAGLEPPQLPPLLSLLAGDQTRTLTATAANRLYARRSTIVGTTSVPSAATLAQRRRNSIKQVVEPPPTYSQKPQTAQNATTSSKFRRRFSVRPTALQIPPGQAPPPGAATSKSQPTLGGSSSSAGGATSMPPNINISQTALKRRLSLRPSPLARELNLVTPSSSSAKNSASSSVDASTSRLLPLQGSAATQRSSTSSMHSPLSRIVQIAQAQQKSASSDSFDLSRNSKSDDKQ